MAISEASAEWTEPGAFAVADGVHRIPLPMPNDGLKAVNVYAIENGDRIALIDTGWDHPAAIAALEAGLAAIGAAVADLNTIIVTHFHADHYALAGPLRERSGAPVLFPEEGLPGVRVALEPETERRANALRLRKMSRHGAGHVEDPFPQAQKVVAGMHWAIPDKTLRDGDVIELADRELQVISVPGHTQGHVAFYDEDAAIFWAADHVLPHITPSIGFEPFPQPLVLRSFLASLEKVRSIPARLVLPAHGPVFDDLQRRVDELLAHHDRRLAECVELVEAGHHSAFAVAGQLLWTKRDTPFSALDAFNRYIAIGETIRAPRAAGPRRADRAPRARRRGSLHRGPGMSVVAPDFDAQIDTLGHIAYVIKRAEHTIEQLVAERLRPHGIGIAKYAVLKVLSERPDSSGAQLARRCFVTPQTMSTVVASLAEQGLVARTTHPENLRVQQTRLTDAGHALLRRCQPDIDAVEAAFLAELSPREQLALDELLRRGTAGLRRLAESG